MSAIAGIAGTQVAATGESLARMFAAMSARTGGARADAVTMDVPVSVALGAARMAWESETGGACGGTLSRQGAITVAADATLYYADDLRRSVAKASTHVAGDSAGALIAAAYAAFGDDCVHRLEGDYAFILWDANRRRLLASRDFVGKRTLFYAAHEGGLVLASTLAGVLACPGVRRAVDLTTVASVAAGVWAHSDETAFVGVRELRAGHSLILDPGGAPVVRSTWRAPETILRTRQPLDDAARELRALLVRATDERMAPTGPTSVSLSGGWDSTAVYAAGHDAIRARSDGRALAPVSISYPEGDPGREDDLIRDVVGHWRGSTRFIPVDGIALFADAATAAGRRDQPMAHTYEEWNRALSRGARAEGARVILDGLGGDQLFQVSDIFLSDLFRHGRWVELARQYRIKSAGRRDLRSLYRWAIRPVLPVPMLRAIAALRRGAPPRHYLDREPPFWFRRDFMARHGVAERERLHRPALPTRDAVLAEGHAFLRFGFYPRIIGMLSAFGLEEGVEVRSPLLDERVVRFALHRPWSERADGLETKILLRRAMQGLLPAHVLAPRAHRTGVTSAYFLRQLRGPARSLVEGTFFLADSRLASLGMIDPQSLERAWRRVLTHDDDELGGRIFFTLQAELWLRAQEPA